MKDIDEIRRCNIRTLEDECKSLASLAKKIGMSSAQLTNLRDGAKDSKTGKPRGMRKETARRIESAANKPVGWLDIDHSQEADIKPASPQVTLIASPPASNTANEIAQAYDKADEVTQLLVKALLLEQGLSAPWVDNFVGMAVMGIKATADKWLKDQSKADQTRSA